MKDFLGDGTYEIVCFLERGWVYANKKTVTATENAMTVKTVGLTDTDQIIYLTSLFDVYAADTDSRPGSCTIGYGPTCLNRRLNTVSQACQKATIFKRRIGFSIFRREKMGKNFII